MNRDYERITEVMRKNQWSLDDADYAEIITIAERLANRITDLENALDEVNRQLEEILREATE